MLRLLDLEANWTLPGRSAIQNHPEHDKRRAKVKWMLTKVMTAEQAEAKLNEPTPPRMHFPKLESCYETVMWEDGSTTNKADFVTELVTKYNQNGILEPSGPGQRVSPRMHPTPRSGNKNPGGEAERHF